MRRIVAMLVIFLAFQSMAAASYTQNEINPLAVFEIPNWSLEALDDIPVSPSVNALFFIQGNEDVYENKKVYEMAKQAKCQFRLKNTPKFGTVVEFGQVISISHIHSIPFSFEEENGRTQNVVLTQFSLIDRVFRSVICQNFAGTKDYIGKGPRELAERLSAVVRNHFEFYESDDFDVWTF